MLQVNVSSSSTIRTFFKPLDINISEVLPLNSSDGWRKQNRCQFPEIFQRVNSLKGSDTLISSRLIDIMHFKLEMVNILPLVKKYLPYSPLLKAEVEVRMVLKT